MITKQKSKKGHALILKLAVLHGVTQSQACWARLHQAAAEMHQMGQKRGLDVGAAGMAGRMLFCAFPVGFLSKGSPLLSGLE